MPKTIERTVYAFDELNDDAKERARDWWRTLEAQDFDHEAVFDDAVECAKLLGIEIDTHAVKLMNGGTRRSPTIYYSGFSSQGDGASFAGRYAYAKGGAKAIREHAPQNHVLHGIADSLQKIQARRFYRLEARIAQSGRYSHSGTMSVEVFDNGDYASEQDSDAVKDEMRAFADWIYRQLEYEWRMADAQIDAAIKANEYDFDESGRPA